MNNPFGEEIPEFLTHSLRPPTDEALSLVEEEEPFLNHANDNEKPSMERFFDQWEDTRIDECVYELRAGEQYPILDGMIDFVEVFPFEETITESSLPKHESMISAKQLHRRKQAMKRRNVHVINRKQRGRR